MDRKELVGLMNRLIVLAEDAEKLSNDFADLATAVAVIVADKQKAEQKEEG